MAEFLMLGQVDNAAAPVAAASEFYWLSDGYGSAVGTDQLLLWETPELAPAGRGGDLVLRRILVPFLRTAACQLRVTPFVDGVPLAATEQSYSSPSEITRAVLTAKCWKRGTYIRARIEVVSRTGLVKIEAPEWQGMVLREAAPLIAVAAG